MRRGRGRPRAIWNDRIADSLERRLLKERKWKRRKGWRRFEEVADKKVKCTVSVPQRIEMVDRKLLETRIVFINRRCVILLHDQARPLEVLVSSINQLRFNHGPIFLMRSKSRMITFLSQKSWQ